MVTWQVTANSPKDVMLLSRKVDFVMSECLPPLRKEQVLREAHLL